MADGVRDEAAFLDAWRRGMVIVGPEFFGDQTGVGETKWDFAPRIDDIELRLSMLSSTEMVFLAAMVSFYNSHIGGKWMSKIMSGDWGMADLAAGLDPARRRVIADLLLAYPGW